MLSSKILSHGVVENLSHVVVEQRRTRIVNVDYGEAWINNVEQRRSMDKYRRTTSNMDS